MEPRIIALSFLVVTSFLASCAASAPPVVTVPEEMAQEVSSVEPDPSYPSCTPGEHLTKSADHDEGRYCRQVATTSPGSFDATGERVCLVCQDTEMECIGSDEDRDLVRVMAVKYIAVAGTQCSQGALFFQKKAWTDVDRGYHAQLHAEEWQKERERAIVQRLLDEYNAREPQEERPAYPVRPIPPPRP